MHVAFQLKIKLLKLADLRLSKYKNINNFTQIAIALSNKYSKCPYFARGLRFTIIYRSQNSKQILVICMNFGDKIFFEFNLHIRRNLILWKLKGKGELTEK